MAASVRCRPYLELELLPGVTGTDIWVGVLGDTRLLLPLDFNRDGDGTGSLDGVVKLRVRPAASSAFWFAPSSL